MVTKFEDLLEYTIFTPLASEMHHHVTLKDRTLEDQIMFSFDKYTKSDNIGCLVEAGGFIYAAFIDLGSAFEATCEPVDWSGLKEFEGYGLREKIKIYLEVWKRTSNLIFLLEIFAILANEYEIKNDI